MEMLQETLQPRVTELQVLIKLTFSKANVKNGLLYKEYLQHATSFLPTNNTYKQPKSAQKPETMTESAQIILSVSKTITESIFVHVKPIAQQHVFPSQTPKIQTNVPELLHVSVYLFRSSIDHLQINGGYLKSDRNEAC